MIEYALETHVFPALRKELRAKLVTQAKNSILEAAAMKLRKWIEVLPEILFWNYAICGR